MGVDPPGGSLSGRNLAANKKYIVGRIGRKPRKHLAAGSFWRLGTLSLTLNTKMAEEDQSNIAERKKAGEFVRVKAAFRETVGADDGKFPVEANRYHLYVAYNCPWCHRVILTRSLLGLQDAISMSNVGAERQQIA